MAYYSTPLYNLSNYQKIEMDPMYQSALQNNITSVVEDDIKFRIDRGLNFIISILGSTGSGKSTIGRYLYKIATERIGSQLTVNDIVFEQTELLEQLKTVEQGHTYIIDENFTVRTGVGSFREQEILNWIQQIVRAYQVNFIFCAPLEVNRLSHYLMKTLDIDYENNMNRSVVHTIDVEVNGMVSILPIGYMLTPAVDVPGYEQKKVDFIQSRLMQKGTQLRTKHKKIAKKILSENNIKKSTSNKVVRTIAEEYESGLSETEYDKITDYVKAFLIRGETKKQK